MEKQNQHNWNGFQICFLLFMVNLTSANLFSQNGKVVIGDGFIVINSTVASPAALIVNNSSTDAIRHSGSGHIISANEYSKINWVMGEAASGTYTFHFGRSTTDYVPFFFEITAQGTGPTGSLSVASWNSPSNSTPPSGVDLCSSSETDVLDRFWLITPSNYSANPTATVNFSYAAADDPTSIGSDLKAQRWNDALSDCKWEAPLGTWMAGSPSYVQVSGLSNFSPWTLTRGSHPLPIELLFFNAALNESVVNITWATESEINNDYFTIERSADGINFSIIDTVKGAGNSTSELHYARTDKNPLHGISYYRLKQTDFDGNYKFTEMVPVNFKGIEVISLQPNPAVSNITFLMNTSEEMEATYFITDIDGRLVKSERIIISEGVSHLPVDISSLAQGMYIFKLVSDDNMHFTCKHFMKTK